MDKQDCSNCPLCYADCPVRMAREAQTDCHRGVVDALVGLHP
jgi:hypothetical protein